jgi:hypothetical protein
MIYGYQQGRSARPARERVPAQDGLAYAVLTSFRCIKTRFCRREQLADAQPQTTIPLWLFAAV